MVWSYIVGVFVTLQAIHVTTVVGADQVLDLGNLDQYGNKARRPICLGQRQTYM